MLKTPLDLLVAAMRHTLIQVVALVTLLHVEPTSAMDAALEPLPYNNPELIVDLGVGLWAWPAPCDADGDGDFDLIVSCPDKPSNGVWLFENSTGDTRQNPLPVFEPAKRISGTVHYVMPSYVNGELRVLSPGREYIEFAKTGTAHSTPLPVNPGFHQLVGSQPKGPKVRHNQWRYCDFDGDGVLDLIVGIEDWSDYGWDDAWSENGQWINGPLHGFVYVLKNLGTNQEPKYDQPVELLAGGQRLDVFGCPSPNLEDFDRDGDLDLICGEFLDGFTWFRNSGTRTAPQYDTGVRLVADDGHPLTMELQMIVPVAFDWDRDGDADLITGDEDGRVAFIENVSKPHDAPPVFRQPRYFQQRADTLKCGALATPCGVDFDADGDFDLVSGNTAGFIEWFENLSGPRVEYPRWSAPKRLTVDGVPFRIMAEANGSIQGPAEAKWGYTTLTVADWNHDDRPDIVFNSILGKVCWLRNTGSPTSPQFAASEEIEVAWESEPPRLAWGWLRPKQNELLTQWRTTPVACDWNDDGLTDLVMLDHEGYLAFYERSKRGSTIVLLPPRRVLQDAGGSPLRLTSGVAGRSGRRKLCVTDWNGDSQPDLLLNSTNADLLIGTTAENGVWKFQTQGQVADRNIEGHDVSPTTVDFDGNGILDFIGGAEDGRMYYLRNPRSR